jgi:DNA-binding CsgD family transcriptional regulator
MSVDDGVLTTIGSLYEAALNPDLWPTALDRVGDLFGQTSLLLTAFDSRDNVLGRSFTSRIDPHSLDIFHQEYNTPQTNPHLGKNHLAPVGQPIVARELCDHDAFLRSGVYADCYRPEGLLDEVNVILTRTDTLMTGVAIMRQARSGPFDSDHARLIRVLVPHFQRAVQINAHVEELQAERSALKDALDRVAFGVILVDGDGHVTVANRVAQEIATEADGLTLSTQGLGSPDPEQAKKLHRAVAAATRTTFPSGGAMSLPRPSGRKPLSVLTCPLGKYALDRGNRRAVATIFITDPEREIEALPEALTRLYGLTRSEAALAILLTQGLDLGEASEHLGVSLSTVRSHLKRILEKTGTHRQTEAVVLILRSLAPISTC